MGDDPAKDGGPVDPFTAMMDGATQLHELHVTYVKAGFSEAQSLYLVGVLLGAALRREPGGDA